MATPVTMPMLGLTMEEGTVVEWLKNEGDTVALDEPLFTVEMDKGTQDVPSPVAGVLRKIIVQPGTTVPVKAVVAEIGAPGEVETTAPAGGPGDLPAVFFEARQRLLNGRSRSLVAPRDGGDASQQRLVLAEHLRQIWAAPRADDSRLLQTFDDCRGFFLWERRERSP